MVSYTGTEVTRIKNELLIILIAESCCLDFHRKIFKINMCTMAF